MSNLKKISAFSHGHPNADRFELIISFNNDRHHSVSIDENTSPEGVAIMLDLITESIRLDIEEGLLTNE